MASLEDRLQALVMTGDLYEESTEALEALVAEMDRAGAATAFLAKCRALVALELDERRPGEMLMLRLAEVDAGYGAPVVVEEAIVELPEVKAPTPAPSNSGNGGGLRSADSTPGNWLPSIDKLPAPSLPPKMEEELQIRVRTGPKLRTKKRSARSAKKDAPSARNDAWKSPKAAKTARRPVSQRSQRKSGGGGGVEPMVVDDVGSRATEVVKPSPPQEEGDGMEGPGIGAVVEVVDGEAGVVHRGAVAVEGPGVGVQAAKPGVKQAAKPEVGEQVSKPEVVPVPEEQAAKPEVEEQVSKPEVVPVPEEQATKPEVEEQASKPEVVPVAAPRVKEQIAKPEVVERASQPEVTAPHVKEQIAKPAAAEQATKPEVGEQASKPEVVPVAEEQATNPQVEEPASKPEVVPVAAPHAKEQIAKAEQTTRPGKEQEPRKAPTPPATPPPSHTRSSTRTSTAWIPNSSRADALRQLHQFYPDVSKADLEDYFKRAHFSLDLASQLVYEDVARLSSKRPAASSAAPAPVPAPVAPSSTDYSSYFANFDAIFPQLGAKSDTEAFLREYCRQLDEFLGRAAGLGICCKILQSKPEVTRIVTGAYRSLGWSDTPSNRGIANHVGWNILWTWSRPKINYASLLDWQRVNHYPNSQQLTRKDNLKRNINKFRLVPGKLAAYFDIIPHTYSLPNDYLAFCQEFGKGAQEDRNANFWIMKPVGLSRGRGIQLLNDIGDVKYGDSVVIQKYIGNPLLLDGFKFDLRLYVLLTSTSPLEAFLYKEGFARFSMEPYSSDPRDIKNRFIHLTNSSIQKHCESRHQVPGGGSDEEQGGTKISLRFLRKKLEALGIDWDLVWSSIVAVVLKALYAAHDQIPVQRNSFELFGFDVLIDQDLKPWLIEVNASPSMAVENALDGEIKSQLIQDTLALVDPLPYDRAALATALATRIQDPVRGAARLNNHNLSPTIDKLLHGRLPRRVGDMPAVLGSYDRIAPSKQFSAVHKTIRGLRSTAIKPP